MEISNGILDQACCGSNAVTAALKSFASVAMGKNHLRAPAPYVIPEALNIHPYRVMVRECGAPRRNVNNAGNSCEDFNASARLQLHCPHLRAMTILVNESQTGVSRISLNPVRAKLVARAENWAWSSVPAHEAGTGPQGSCTGG